MGARQTRVIVIDEKESLFFGADRLHGATPQGEKETGGYNDDRAFNGNGFLKLLDGLLQAATTAKERLISGQN